VNKDLAAFEGAIEKKLKDKDFDFRGVYFPGSQSFASFLPNGTFKGEANFAGAIFEGETNFTGAIFEGAANFTGAIFKRAANFFEVTFKDTACFFATTFEGAALFWRAKFEGDAYFPGAKFLKRTGFSARKNYTAFNPDCEVNFDYVEIEKPELFAFRSLTLRTSWLLYVQFELEKLYFHNVIWQDTQGRPRRSLRDEAKRLGKREVRSPVPPFDIWTDRIQKPYRLLETKYGELYKNYEEKRDYPLANDFHYLSMEAKRMANREQGRTRLEPIATLYWVLSGYGDRPGRAFLVLVGMGVLFAILYVMVAGSIEHVGQAFLYSMAAMVRLTGVPAMAPLTKLLQPPEPGLFQLLVTAEGILGPLQIALLALAVRRRVMR
jgi:hypothetical protein